MNEHFHKIRFQVMWDRLIALVEEQARTLMRVAFSPVVREAGDVSAGVFNPAGDLLAQAVTGTPGHVNSMALSVKHFITEFPVGTMKEGDAFITNDPWRGTGHLFDLTVVTPAFYKGKIVALFACTAHVADIGGNAADMNSRDVLAEGLFIPIMPLCTGGEINPWLMNLVRANSREPDRLEGDIYALVACNETGATRLDKMMREYEIDTLDTLSKHILETSDRSMLDVIAKLPKGTWTNSMRIDGFDSPIDFVGALTIDDEAIRLDFAGTSGVSKYGINSPLCYTEAYTSFGIKCLVAPRLANNAAILARIRVTAPENSILNPKFPAPVTGRSLIGQMLPDVAFGCFDKAIPGFAPAEGTAASWSLRMGGGPGLTGKADGKVISFTSQSYQSGGMGAHPNQDGLSATPYPSGVKAIAVEITEALTPLVFWRKELRADSGGAGYRRGGLGQVIEVGSRENAPFALYAKFDRVDNPPRGRDGGLDGLGGRLSLRSGAHVSAKGTQLIPPGDRLIAEMPGGGGLGDPARRDPQDVLKDVVDGLVSKEAARDLYKVAIAPNQTIDQEGTRRLRAA